MNKLPQLLFCFLVFPVVLSCVGEQWLMSQNAKEEVTAANT